MFNKINLNLSEIDISELKGIQINSYGDTFHEFELLNQSLLFEILSTKIKFDILPSRCLITDILSPGAGPHTDAWPTALNYYFNAGDDITYFFNEINNTGGYEHREVRRYPRNNLKIVGTFLANKDECYLLNTHRIHAVYMPVPKKTRTMLRFVWFNHNYDAVLNSINLL